MAEKSMDAGADIQSFKLTLRLDCTVNVNGQDWVKPGASVSTVWDDVPTEGQLRAAATFMQKEVLNPTLDDVLVEISERIVRSRRGDVKKGDVK